MTVWLSVSEEHKGAIAVRGLAAAAGYSSHLQTPGAAGVLCPGVGGHEGPLGKPIAPVIIIGPLT